MGGPAILVYLPLSLPPCPQVVFFLSVVFLLLSFVLFVHLCHPWFSSPRARFSHFPAFPLSGFLRALVSPSLPVSEAPCLCVSVVRFYNSVDELKHELIRESLKLLGIDSGIEITSR